MNNEVFEEVQGAEGGAKAKLEKQARQLAYDTKYKVKQALAAKSGGKADPATVSKMYMAQLSKSPAPPAVKALAKKKLLGEEYIDTREFAVESVTQALLKVFAEKKEEVVEEVIEEEKGEAKFHVRVRDKKTGNTYHRYATRAKIAELRANPNIESVEMTHQGEGETKKAKKDYDGDGKVESSSKEHAGAVHNAIQRKKGGVPDGKDTRKEEVEITEKKSEETNIGGGNLKKLATKAAKRIDADVDGDVDTDDPKSTEMGEFVPSADGKKRIKTKVQREDFLSDWRDELFEGKKKNEDGEEVIDVMKGKNKITVSPTIGEKLELAKEECGENGEPCKKCGKSPCECEEDSRGMKTKVNLVRNKLRAMGLKMSHEPEGELIEARDESEEQEKQQRYAEKGQKETLANIKKITGKKQRLDKEKYTLQRKGKLPLNMSNEAEGEQLDELAPLAGLAVKAGLAAGTAMVGKMVYDKGKKVADKIKQQNQQKSDMIKNLGNSFEPEGEMTEATYPSDFRNPDGSKRAVAKKKYGRPKQHDQETDRYGRRKTVDESAEDRLRDRRMERGGVGGNQRYDRAPKAPNTKKFGTGKTMAQKEMEKKYGKGASAMDIVKAQIRAKHGKGAIMDTKKK